MGGARLFQTGFWIGLAALVITFVVLGVVVAPPKTAPAVVAQNQAMVDSLLTLEPGDLVRSRDGMLYAVVDNPYLRGGNDCLELKLSPSFKAIEVCPRLHSAWVSVIYRRDHPLWSEFTKRWFGH